MLLDEELWVDKQLGVDYSLTLIMVSAAHLSVHRDSTRAILPAACLDLISKVLGEPKYNFESL